MEVAPARTHFATASAMVGRLKLRKPASAIGATPRSRSRAASRIIEAPLSLCRLPWPMRTTPFIFWFLVSSF